MSCLVVLAAGLGSRFGGPKQLVTLGPLKRTLLEYNICHAVDAGFRRVVLVIQGQSRELVERQLLPRLPQDLEVFIAEQNNLNLPPECISPSELHKPLGTAHALWCARRYVNSSFAVINGDDYYGSEAFEKLAECSLDKNTHHAIVTYQLGKTLSSYGGVNRGICEVSTNNPSRIPQLTGVRECLEIIQNEKVICGHFDDSPSGKRAAVKLNKDCLVSMNCWLFNSSIFKEIENGLIRHFEGKQTPRECYLPEIVTQLIESGAETIKLLKSNQNWFGITYRQDRQYVEDCVTELTRQGAFNSLSR